MKYCLLLLILLLTLSGCKSDSAKSQGESAPSQQGVSTELMDEFWEQFVSIDVMGKPASELFGTLSTYYYVRDGLEVLFPYEDCVYFSGPAWESGSVSVIANFVNRSGEDYAALAQEAYGDEAILVYDEQYQQNCILVIDRGYELRFYLSDTGYTEFFEYRKQGYSLPFNPSDESVSLLAELPDNEIWAAVAAWQGYLGQPAEQVSVDDALIQVIFEHGVCNEIVLSAKGTWFQNKGILDITSLGLPFSLHGGDDTSQKPYYLFQFEEGLMVKIFCSASDDVGDIYEDSLISIYFNPN